MRQAPQDAKNAEEDAEMVAESVNHQLILKVNLDKSNGVWRQLSSWRTWRWFWAGNV
jgi:hypothetical protein